MVVGVRAGALVLRLHYRVCRKLDALPPQITECSIVCTFVSPFSKKRIIGKTFVLDWIPNDSFA